MAAPESSTPAAGSPSFGTNTKPSWTPRLNSPPRISARYKPENALDDLDGVTYALDTFLNSQMIECEEYCHASDLRKERLYFATGYGLIQCVKALMSYEDEVGTHSVCHPHHLCLSGASLPRTFSRASSTPSMGITSRNCIGRSSRTASRASRGSSSRPSAPPASTGSDL